MVLAHFPKNLFGNHWNKGSFEVFCNVAIVNYHKGERGFFSYLLINFFDKTVATCHYFESFEPSLKCLDY